jgi:hypothetical protein
MKKIGSVFVDAGIVMVGDPCYTLSDDASHRTEVATDWSKFCEMMFAPGPHQRGHHEGEAVEPLGEGVGIVVQTGWGDGEYPVFVEYAGGRIARLVVEFIPDEDEDDWDEDEDEGEDEE